MDLVFFWEDCFMHLRRFFRPASGTQLPLGIQHPTLVPQKTRDTGGATFFWPSGPWINRGTLATAGAVGWEDEILIQPPSGGAGPLAHGASRGIGMGGAIEAPSGAQEG